MSASIDQLSVNHLVPGSSPGRGANTIKHLAQIALGAFLLGYHWGSTSADTGRSILSLYLNPQGRESDYEFKKSRQKNAVWVSSI